MATKLVHLFFFGNYYIGLLLWLLTAETCLQLHIPLPHLAWLVAASSGAVYFYTWAYARTGEHNTTNPRLGWYFKNSHVVAVSQWIMAGMFFGCFAIAIFILKNGIGAICLLDWWFILALGVAVFMYSGTFLPFRLPFTIRNSGLAKPLVIGFVWAGAVSFLPILVVKMETGRVPESEVLTWWLIVKNWMFCTVNAVMFDIKDYAADSNQRLQTVVVRLGLRRTIFFLLIPLLFIGMFSFIGFTGWMQFPLGTVLCNFVPFAAMLAACFSLQKRHSMLYYLVVVDGILVLKAICGITGSFF